MESCCFKNYGYEIVTNQITNDRVLPTKGRFEVKIENTGEVSCFVGGVGEIPPGQTACIGIPQVPCAIDLPITYGEEAGEKKVVVHTCRLVQFDWSCLNG